MESSRKKKISLRNKRRVRVRKSLRGTATKPRLCVVKSNMHIEAQLIDDQKGATLVSAGTRSKDLRTTEFNRANMASAAVIGKMIGEKAKQLNVETVVFDRGHSKYHGVIAALADAARAEGLKF